MVKECCLFSTIQERKIRGKDSNAEAAVSPTLLTCVHHTGFPACISLSFILPSYECLKLQLSTRSFGWNSEQKTPASNSRLWEREGACMPVTAVERVYWYVREIPDLTDTHYHVHWSTGCEDRHSLCLSAAQLPVSK